MPARATMLDEIGEKMRGATVKEIVRPICCFKECRKAASYFVVLRFNDGRTDMFGVCERDKAAVVEQHPSTLEKAKDQAFFLY